MRSNEFTLSLTGPGMKLDQTVPEAVARRIFLLVFGVDVASAAGSVEPAGGGQTDPRQHSLREFIDEHQAQRNPEKIAAIAAYFEDFRGVRDVTKDVLMKGFAEAKEASPRNIHRDIAWAIKIGWLAPKDGSDGVYFLTATGNKAVKARFPADIRKKTRQSPGGTKR